MLQFGSGFTVKTTSLVVKLLVHLHVSCTVSRNVAVAGAPVSVTVVVREPGFEIETKQLLATTVQFVDVRSQVPGCADPAIVNVVVSPCVHLA